MSKVEKQVGYAHAKGAREAARKVLGKEAVEGAEFKVFPVGDRFDWEAIEAVKRKGRSTGAKGFAAPKAEGQIPTAAQVAAFPTVAKPVTRETMHDKSNKLIGAMLAREAAKVDEPEPAPSNKGASAFGAAAFAALSVDARPAAEATGRAAKEQAPKKVRTPPEIVNGVRKPSVGTVCRAVWDELDKMNVTAQPDSKQVKALAERMQWNPNNASIEFYQWRKFHGITGRAPKVEVKTAAKAKA